MNTNAWITLENNLALSWWQYYKWITSEDQTPEDEPAISEWDKKAIRKLVNIEHAFQAFKKASMLGKDWRLLSVWDVTTKQLNMGYAQHGNAEEGGNYAVAGFWTWNSWLDPICRLSDQYNWRPNQVLQFIPDECVDPDCREMQPATELWDVVLLHGQPAKEMPSQTVLTQ